MTSAINTTAINPNYPVPGINNSTQGFRDNFSSIQTNLNTAADEITLLQNSAVLKTGLPGQVLNNDVQGNPIINVLTQGFRGTVSPLGQSGTNLSGALAIEPLTADLYYGTLTGTSVLSFTPNSWAAVGSTSSSSSSRVTSNVTVQLTATTSPVTVTLPTGYSGAQAIGSQYLQTYTNGNITVPANTTTVLEFSSNDGGNTVYVQPLYAPPVAQAESRTVSSSVGQSGDIAGQMAADSSYLYVCTANFDGSTAIWKRIALTAF